jgi:hypothetical protein
MHRDLSAIQSAKPDMPVFFVPYPMRHCLLPKPNSTSSDIARRTTARQLPVTCRATDHAVITLVTCYPFNALEPNGPLRYVVFTEALEASRRIPGS